MFDSLKVTFGSLGLPPDSFKVLGHNITNSQISFQSFSTNITRIVPEMEIYHVKIHKDWFLT